MYQRRVAIVAAAVAAAAAGCGESGDECTTGVTDGTITIAVGDFCLRDARATGLHEQAWTEAQVELDSVGPGAVRAVLAAADDARGLRLTVPAVDVDQMLQQGYQSWGFSGAVLIPRQLSYDDAGGAPLMAAARSGDPVDEERGVSSNVAVFRRGSDGPALVVGALRAEVAVTAIAAISDGQTAEIDILYGPQRELLPAGGDGTARSEPLLIASADTPEQALALYSAALEAELGAEVATRRPPAGWFSWNEHFDRIDEALILAHAALVETELAPRGMPLVEIDDGWERAWGDWQANDSFPNGMGPVAADIEGRGLVAGVWLAPFLVDVQSDSAQLDPSLFVQGPDGKPLVHRIGGNPRSFYLLDGSNPASMAIVTDELAALSAAGYSFFKLDFLYGGAIAGGRSMDVTGVQALRAGMEKIRAAVGPDAVINACGSPTLSIVGVADSLRIGPDTAFDGFDLSWSAVAAAARSLAARRHLWPLIWLDADQVQLRQPFTADEAKAGAAVAALAGVAYSIGDDLTLLDADRLAIGLDDIILDIAHGGEPGQPIGIMDAPSDEIAASPIIEAIRFPAGYASAPPAAFGVTGASGTTYRVSFDWEGARSVTIE